MVDSVCVRDVRKMDDFMDQLIKHQKNKCNCDEKFIHIHLEV